MQDHHLKAINEYVEETLAEKDKPKEKVKGVKLNPALEDIKEIIEERPELEAEEWAVVDKATPWLKTMLRPQVRTELEKEYAEKNRQFQEELSVKTQELVKKNMEEWQKSQEPLSNEELNTLLTKEYIEFPVEIYIGRGKAKVLREFTIFELPQESESRFIKIVQQRFIPLIEKLSAMEWTLDGSALEQLQAILANIPEAFEMSKDLVAVCLDPFEENKEINPKWVGRNLSTFRIATIILAQVEANKYRDFFLNGSRSFRSLKKKVE